jgi:fermentation-respiration switch protein FrsA (DUF1100 family)
VNAGAEGARRRRRLVRLLAVLFVLILLLCLPRLWRYGLAAALLIDTLQAGEISLLSHLGPAPVRFPVRIPKREGPTPADLYLPGAGYPRQAILLVHGVNEAGKDDARIVALASNLARARAAVLVPDFQDLKRLRVSPADAEAVVLAYSGLLDRFAQLCGPGRADGCGLFSFSYGVGPTLIAAADPRGRDRIGFVVAFGGYAPYPWAKWVFLASNATYVSDEADRRRLQEIAHRRLGDGGADVQPLTEQLGPEGRAVWALVTNRDPGRTEALVAALNPALRETIAQLSPLPRLADVRARLLLAHGLRDRSIPFTESERLAARAGSRARLTITRIFEHVDPAGPARPGLSGLRASTSEALRMIGFAEAILAQGR